MKINATVSYDTDKNFGTVKYDMIDDGQKTTVKMNFSDIEITEETLCKVKKSIFKKD